MVQQSSTETNWQIYPPDEKRVQLKKTVMFERPVEKDNKGKIDEMVITSYIYFWICWTENIVKKKKLKNHRI